VFVSLYVCSCLFVWFYVCVCFLSWRTVLSSGGWIMRLIGQGHLPYSIICYLLFVELCFFVLFDCGCLFCMFLFLLDLFVCFVCLFVLRLLISIVFYWGLFFVRSMGWITSLVGRGIYRIMFYFIYLCFFYCLFVWLIMFVWLYVCLFLLLCLCLFVCLGRPFCLAGGGNYEFSRAGPSTVFCFFVGSDFMLSFAVWFVRLLLFVWSFVCLLVCLFVC